MAVLAWTGAALGEEVWTWVSVGGNNGAIKVSTNGTILAQTTGAAYTFDALCVNAFTGDLLAWYNQNNDNQFASRLYRFGASGNVIASTNGLRGFGYPSTAGKKMALDPVARNMLYVTSGGYYAAEGGYYEGIREFLLSGAVITPSLETNILPSRNGYGAVIADVDLDSVTHQSLVYYGETAGNPTLFIFAATNFSSPIASNASGYANSFAGMALYRGARALGAISGYNNMDAFNPVVTNTAMAVSGSSPGTAPNPPFGPSPQAGPSTNGLWWNYFVGNPNFAVTAVGTPVPRGILVDDVGHMWLSTYGTANSGAYTNRWLIRLNLTNGAMAAGFPISLSNQCPSYGLALDSAGYVWMGTTNGNLYRFSSAGGDASGSGSNLVYSIPPSALVFTTNQTLVLGAGDATGYDHKRKYYIPPPKGTVILIR